MTLQMLVKQYLDEHGMSARKFAEKAGLSNNFVSLIVKGKGPKGSDKPMVPKLSNLQKFADAMGMTLDELLNTCDDLMVNYLDVSDTKKDLISRVMRMTEQEAVAADLQTIAEEMSALSKCGELTQAKIDLMESIMYLDDEKTASVQKIVDAIKTL